MSARGILFRAGCALIGVALAFAFVMCTAGCTREVAAFQKDAEVTCWSAGRVIIRDSTYGSVKTSSTGVVSFFSKGTGAFVRVTADCMFTTK